MSQKVEAGSHHEGENMYWSHLAMTIAQCDAELYGTLHFGRRMPVEVMLFILYRPLFGGRPVYD